MVFTHHRAPGPSYGGFCTPSRTRPTAVFVYHCAPIPRLHHLPPIPRLFLYTITHPPNDSFLTIAHLHNGSFCTPSHTCTTVVFVHHRTPAQRWFSCTIVHPFHCGFCTPSPTRTIVVFTHHHPPISLQFLYTIVHHPTAVFVHHHAPAQLWFSYTIVPIPRRFLYTIAHPPNCGFRTPSCTHPTAVFVHHRAPVLRWFSHTHLTAVFVYHRPPISWRFLYAIVHPPHSGFFTVAHPRRFLYTITHAPNCGFQTPLPLIVPSPWHLAYAVIQHDCVPAAHGFHYTPTPAITLLTATHRELGHPHLSQIYMLGRRRCYASYSAQLR